MNVLSDSTRWFGLNSNFIAQSGMTACHVIRPLHARNVSIYILYIVIYYLYSAPTYGMSAIAIARYSLLAVIKAAIVAATGIILERYDLLNPHIRTAISKVTDLN